MRYGLHYRPAGVGAVPKGDYTMMDHPHFRHGVIEYTEPLTAEKVHDFQLVPIVPVAEHAALLVKRMGVRRDKYRAKPDYVSHFVDQFRWDDGVFSTADISELTAEVTRIILDDG